MPNDRETKPELKLPEGYIDWADLLFRGDTLMTKEEIDATESELAALRADAKRWRAHQEAPKEVTTDIESRLRHYKGTDDDK